MIGFLKLIIMGENDKKSVNEMAYERQNNNGSFKRNQNGRGSLRDLTLKVTLENRVEAIKISIMFTWPRAGDTHVTLKLEMDELFSASFNVSFTQWTIVSSLTFCPPPSSSRIFRVYLNKIKNDFWRKVAKEFTIV